MQDQDVITKEFYGDAARVADFVNGYLFEGVQLVRQEDIRELDSSMFGKIKWFGRWTTRQRYRDIVRRVLLGVRFAIIGVEEQGLVHFAMPVRALGYNFLSYDRQLKKIRKKHILLKDLRGSAQVLSGISPKDLLAPCVTIIVYYGEDDRNRTDNVCEQDRKSDEELYNLSHMGATSGLSAETFLERTYLLDGWIFCVQCGQCFRRDAEEIHRKSRIRR